MRTWLLLALLLYDYIDAARYVDYDETEKTRHLPDDRRLWRKKALQSEDRREWGEERSIRRHDYDRYPEDVDSVPYRHDPERGAEYPPGDKEPELRAKPVLDKETEKKQMTCDKEHERYENCFAGCAAVSCDNPRERLRPCYPFCEPGCVCVPPYVRDDRTHKCVLPQDCTKGLKGIPDLGDVPDV